MKVGIDLLHARPGKCGAVSNLWRNNLSLLPLIREDIEYIVFLRQELFDYYQGKIKLHPNLKFFMCDVNGRSALNRIRFQEVIIPRLIEQNRCDILFTSSPTPTITSTAGIEIFKITGIQFYSRPKEFGWLRSLYHHYSTRKKTLRSKYIIVNSHYVKKEILKRIDIPDEKLKVIYESLDHDIFNNKKSIHDCRKIIAEKWGIKGKFLLYVSDIRPYKNPLSLINAFESLRSKLKDYQLILIGQDIGGFKTYLIEYVKKKKLTGKVIFFDYMEPFNFVFMMRAAEIFIYPSSLETFGTIPLEAMACGTAVIAGNETAIPEICGDSALLVDGKNHQQIADAILQIMNGDNLKTELINKGLSHVKSFSWEKNAAETVEVFKQAISDQHKFDKVVKN